MCLVEVEKMPKLMTACTLPVAEGMVVRTETPQVAAARKYTLEFLLTNHPLDCPVCDKGGECELQDMVFRYGAGESRFTEDEGPRARKAIVAGGVLRCAALHPVLPLRARLQRRHGRGRAGRDQSRRGFGDRAQPGRPPGVRRVRRVHRHLPGGRAHQRHLPLPDAALGNDPRGHHLHALLDGCKTTLGVRNDHIIRGNNRDRSGINGEFLCIKGRYAFDFYDHPERLQAPLVRMNGKLEEVSWSRRWQTVAQKFNETMAGGGRFGVIGSNHTTNEENYLPAEIRPRSAGHQQYRPSPHRRRGDAAGRAERQDRQAGHRGGSVRAQGGAGDRRRPGAGASAALATRFAPTTGITRRTSTP